MPKRLNQDDTLNARGQSILDLCVSGGLRILNGRVPGDSQGYFTCHKYNGSSTVDYVMVDELYFGQVLYFHVHKNLSDMSDHCMISFRLKNLISPVVKSNPLPLIKMPNNFKWNAESAQLFQNALTCPDIQAKIQNFLSTPFSENAEGMHSASASLSSIILTAVTAFS